LTDAVDGASAIVIGGGGGAAVTVTCAAADLVGKPFDVAMIVEVPGATAVTTPVVALTVATAVFEDEYVTPENEPVESFCTLPTNVTV
jgi:methyl coenzyme M reductase subunit C